MKRPVYYLLLIIFAATFLVSGYALVDYYMESYKQQSVYDDLAQMVADARSEAPTQPGQAAAPEAPTRTNQSSNHGDSHEIIHDDNAPPSDHVAVTDPETGEVIYILKEYAGLYQLNSDLVGWIQVPNTNISHPVMQSETKDYYLHVNFYDEYSSHGSIYVREECDVFAPSDNLTIYGHHMVDGTMFADLLKYAKQDFWEENKLITFDTIFEHHTYEIIAVFRTSAAYGEGFTYHQFIDADDEEEFDRFVARCKDLALYDTGLTAEHGDKLISLSTCDATLHDGRLVVVAKRIP